MDSGCIMITGIGGPAGKSAVDYLRKKGYSTIGTDSREIKAPVDLFYKVPCAEHASFADTLIQIIRKRRPSLLIPTVSEELPIISTLQKRIERFGCMVFISPSAATDIAHDKFKTAAYLHQHGIPSPRSFDGNTPHEDVLNELRMPFLSKPRIGRGGRGIVLYRSGEEFFSDARTGLIFQEFIPGDEFDLNMFIDKSGEVLASVVLRKTVLKEGLVGNAVEVERVNRKDVDNLGRRIAKTMDLEGPIDMDIRLRRDGTPVVLEINARLGANVLSAPEILDNLIKAWEKQKTHDTKVEENSIGTERKKKGWDR